MLVRLDPPRSDTKYINPQLVRTVTVDENSGHTVVEFDPQHKISVDIPIAHVVNAIIGSR
jgi:hypothetical protein